LATQRETTHVVKPFIRMLKDRGWRCKNVIGNQYQQGFPDYFIMHENYSSRWVEFKVRKGNIVTLTPAQRIEFPEMISRGVPIYVIAAEDLRGSVNQALRERMYRKLFEEPNAIYALSKQMMINLF